MTEKKMIRVTGEIANGHIDAHGDRFTPEALKSMAAQINADLKDGKTIPINFNFTPGTNLGSISEAKVEDGRLLVSAEVPEDFKDFGVGVGGYSNTAFGRGPKEERVIERFALTDVSLVLNPVHPDLKLRQELFPKKD